MTFFMRESVYCYLIRVDNRVKSVRYSEDSTSTKVRTYSGLYKCIGLRVYVGCSLIQHQDFVVAYDGAS